MTDEVREESKTGEPTLEDRIASLEELERKHPRHHRVLRENWYRDVWLFLISALLFAGEIQGQHTATTASKSAITANRIANQAKVLAAQNQKLTKESHALAVAIQAQRVNTITRQCKDQNTRHNNTLKTFQNTIRYYTKHPRPGQSTQNLKISIQQNIALFNAAIPKQDCKKLVKASTTN